MDWSRSHLRIFRALLHCYPADFRHEYGGEMEQLFTDRLQSEPRWRLWIDTVTDVALNAPKEHWHTSIADVKYGIRVLAGTPGFTGIAILVIALGIGATVSVFSVVNAVLLRSLPYGHPEELVYLWSPNPGFKGVPLELGPNVPDFYDWQKSSHSFQETALLRATAVNVEQGGSADRMGAAFVTGDFFRMMEASPELGRTIAANDDTPGRERVAVIGDELWRSRFDASPAVIGKQLRLNRQAYTVIGVMPKDFGYPFEGDIPYESSGFRQTSIWLPAAYTPNQKSNRTNFDSAVAIGRLRPEVSTAAAQAELNAIETRLQPLYPEMWRGWNVLVKPLVQTIIGPVGKMLWLLFGAVALVLLIAMSNVANLLLARMSARAHELGIRSALGADRARIIRQLLTESLVLSFAGGACGVALAYGAVHLLTSLNPGSIPRFDTTSVDGRALFVAVLLSIFCGILSGLAPAISASRANVNELLKKAGDRLAGGANRSRFALIVIEVALSVVLLTASGLLIRSYLELAAVDPGFSPETLTFKLKLDERYSKPELRSSFYNAFLAKLETIPAFRYVGASSSTPLSHHESLTFAEIRGYGKSTEMVEDRSISPRYLKALGTPLLRGRDFDLDDASSKTPVAIVNQRFAAVYFDGRNALGGQIRTGMGNFSGTSWATIVGIVGNVRHASLEEVSLPQIFRPARSGDNFAIAYRGSAQQAIAESRAALRSLDSALTLGSVRTMGERMKESNARRNFQTTLLTGFAAIAIFLALAGLYGLMSFAVKHRTAEIGIRLAVGATPAGVLRLILAQGLRLTILGLAAGLCGAVAVTRLMSGWLFAVKSTDPLTFLVVPLFVLAVACCACIIPAWSATRIDPVQALRRE